MDKNKSNRFSLFLLSFSFSTIAMYALTYFPVYFFDILNVNRTALAFVQFLSYSSTFILIGVSWLFDKYNINKRIVITTGSICILVSFYLCISSLQYLAIFGIFLAINMICRSIVRGCFSKLYFQCSPDEKSRNTNLFLMILGATLGSFMPVLFFITLFNDNLDNPTRWTTFFTLGVLLSVPILIVPFLVKNPLPKPQEKIYSKEHNKLLLPAIILLSFSYFLIMAESLITFPFPSFIIEKFGVSAFNFYYLFLYVVMIGGLIVQYFVAKHLAKHKKVKIVIITGLFYSVLFALIPFSNFTFFVIVNYLICIIKYVLFFTFKSIIIEISQEGKYENLRLQLMSSAITLSNIIFIPLGIYLSSYLLIEILIFISAGLIMIALLTLYLSHLLYKKIKRLSVKYDYIASEEVQKQVI